MVNYRQDGNTMRITAKTDIKPGEVVVVGSMVGVANTDILKDAEGVIFTTGVFEFLADGAIEQGADVEYDPATRKVKAKTEAGVSVGKAWTTATDVVWVKING